MNHFCLLCGTPLLIEYFENREREVCPTCQWVYYPQLKVTAGVLVEKNQKILLVQREIEPWKGLWYLPAGYVENDEAPIDAAEREANEETGLCIKTKKLINVYFYEDDPRGNGLLVLYEGEIIGGEIDKNHEAQAVKFFSSDEIRKLYLAGGSHDRAIQDWLNCQRLVISS